MQIAHLERAFSDTPFIVRGLGGEGGGKHEAESCKKNAETPAQNKKYGLITQKIRASEAPEKLVPEAFFEGLKNHFLSVKILILLLKMVHKGLNW